MRTVLLVGLVLGLTVACHLPQQSPVTPQRPTVSSDTSTTAKGTVEVEAGVTVDPNDSFDSPITVKYGTSDDTELFVGYSPLQFLNQPGRDADGGSDLVIGARHRLWHEGDGLPSGAVLVSGKLPTASTVEGLGSGEVDLRFGGILHQQFGEIGANAFYQYGALGNPGGAGTFSEHTGALTAGMAFDERWAGFAELAGIFVPSQKTDTLLAILGVTHAIEPWWVLDAGVTIGLSEDAPDLQLFFGCTYNFGAPLARRN